MSKLEKLAVDHPYYCSDSNFYSNEPRMRYETLEEFLEEWEDADIDMNLIFRWDVHVRDEDNENFDDYGPYYAEVFIIHQRKGIFRPIWIDSVREEDYEIFTALLSKHYARLKEVWEPLV